MLYQETNPSLQQDYESWPCRQNKNPHLIAFLQKAAERFLMKLITKLNLSAPGGVKRQNPALHQTAKR